MNLKNAIGFISEKYKTPSVCESCGEEFTCGATLKGCWCMNVEITEKTREQLKAEFKNCLCKNCLEKFNSAEV